VVKRGHLVGISAACLTSTLLETGAGANDCKCNRDQRLSSEARRSEILNFCHPSYDHWERCLASAIARRSLWYRAPHSLTLFCISLHSLFLAYVCFLRNEDEDMKHFAINFIIGHGHGVVWSTKLLRVKKIVNKRLAFILVHRPCSLWDIIKMYIHNNIGHLLNHLLCP
jgi:hypothetical protein